MRILDLTGTKSEVQKHITIISPGFPGDENDTTCLPSQQLLVRAINRNFPEIKISIVSLQYPYHTIRYYWHGNLVIPLNGKKFSGLYRPLLWLKAKSTIENLHQQQSIDGILSLWCQETALIGNRFSKKTIPHKIWVSGQDARSNNRFVKWIKPTPDQLMAMSDFLVDEFYRNHKIQPAHLVRNGIDLNTSVKVPDERDIDILGVGSLIPLKQYSIFVDVVNAIVRSGRNVKAVLVGDGADRANLTKKIQALQVQNNIELVGTRPHHEVLKLYSRSKVFLHPSAYEGFSTACLEALSGGCKVLSFTRAMREEIPNWRIVCNIDEMHRATHELLNTPQVHSPMAYSSIDDSAKQIINLFFERV